MNFVRSLALPCLFAALAACDPGKLDPTTGSEESASSSTGGGPTTLGVSSSISGASDPGTDSGGAVSGSTTQGPGDTTLAGDGTTLAPDGTTLAPDFTTGVSTGETLPGTSTSGADPGENFIVPADLPEPFDCDPWLENCPVGEKCMPFDSGGGTWDSLKCSPIDAQPQPPGAACSVEGGAQSGVDDCELHSMCWSVDNATLTGTCVEMCSGSPNDPTCPQGTVCSQSNGSVLNLCLPTCDPLASDCVPGQVCVSSAEVFVCVLDASGDEGQTFDPCEFINVCDPGLFCASSEFSPECDLDFAGCCLPHCDLDAPVCPQGLDCVPWYEEGFAPAGNEHIGACIVPF